MLLLLDWKSKLSVPFLRLLQMSNLVLWLLWQFLHVIVFTWYSLLVVKTMFESYLISGGILKRYKSLNLEKLQYLAVVIESEEAQKVSNVVQLLRWLDAIGVKNVCLYDMEGKLKKFKKVILESFVRAKLFELQEDYRVTEPSREDFMNVEFASYSDGKEAVTKAANSILSSYVELQSDQIFTEPHMTEVLEALGCRGPDPDLLLVYGPVRCHLGFPAWRIRYTEIVHMGRLRHRTYGSLLKAIYKFTTVKQNYGR